MHIYFSFLICFSFPYLCLHNWSIDKLIMLENISLLNINNFVLISIYLFIKAYWNSTLYASRCINLASRKKL